jgi:alkylation response protein AidB-like acyl-CoA dehydrogenase
VTGASPAASPAELEAFLGDPHRDGAPLSYATAVRTDARGEPDAGAYEALRGWGLPGFLVPESAGGRLRSLAEPFALFRCVARRDLRVAVGYGSTFLSAVPVWLWGTDRQRALVADRIGAGGLGAAAISERAHGSDLLRTECRALRDGDGYAVRGEKWPIGNATRGEVVTLLARTSASAFSLLLLDKRELPAAGWRCLPAASTVGLRGHDLSGLVFDDCPVPAVAVLGAEGTGLAQILRTLQVTRTLVAGLSLGALDTALRVAAAYAGERRLYGAPIDRMPVIRDLLVRAYADLLIGECVALPAVRAVGAAPGRLHRWSAVTKYLVPVLAEESIAGLATVLSARAYLADEPAARLFQKVQRDHAVMSVFDGTTHVNLAALTGMPPPGRPAAGTRPDRDRVLAALFRLDEPAPAWRPDGDALALSAGDADEITQGWPAAVAELEDRADGTSGWRVLLDVLESWHRVRARYQAGQRALPAGPGRHPPVRAFALARTHCLFHAAASCVHRWRLTRSAAPEPEWLLLCLQRLLQRLDAEQELSAPAMDWAERALREQAAKDQLFSLQPVQLAG